MSESTQDFVLINQESQNNSSDDSEMEIISKSSFSTSNSYNAHFSPLIPEYVCTNATLPVSASDLSFYSQMETSRFQNSLHLLHKELANSILLSDRCCAARVPSRASSSEPYKLQIIQATNVGESLPESDSQLADTQYGANFELDDLADVEESSSISTSSGRSSRARVDSNSIDTTGSASTLLNGVDVMSPTRASEQHVQLHHHHHHRNGHQDHSTIAMMLRRDATLARDQQLTRLAFLVLLFSFAFGLGHFLASTSLRRQMTDNVACFNSVFDRDSNSRLRECQQGYSELTSSLERLKTIMVLRTVSDSWQSAFLNSQRESDKLKSSITFVSSQLEECQNTLTKNQNNFREHFATDDKPHSRHFSDDKPAIGFQSNFEQPPAVEIKKSWQLKKLHRKLKAMEHELDRLYALLMDLCSSVTVGNCSSSKDAVANSTLNRLDAQKSFLRRVILQVLDACAHSIQSDSWASNDNADCWKQFLPDSKSIHRHVKKFLRKVMFPELCVFKKSKKLA